jgi:hypothetical protein
MIKYITKSFYKKVESRIFKIFFKKRFYYEKITVTDILVTNHCGDRNLLIGHREPANLIIIRSRVTSHTSGQPLGVYSDSQIYSRSISRSRKRRIYKDIPLYTVIDNAWAH